MAVNKVLLLAGILLFAVPESTSFPRCCHQRKCDCKLFELLFGSGNHAAGILTLGKRGSDSAKPFGAPFLVDAERQEQPVANGVGGFPDVDARQRSLSSPRAIREPRLQDLPSVCSRLLDRLVKCLALERTRRDGSTRGQCDSYAKLCGNLSLVF